MNEITAQMINQAAAGDQAAITALYESTYSSVYKTVKSMIRDEDTVLDIVQDSYIKGFQNLQQLTSPDAYPAWMKRIATNKAKDYLKKKKPVLFSDLTTEEEEPDFKEDRLDHCPEAVIEQQETTRLINEILDSLSDEQRLVVGMFYYEEMTIREIAETIGCSENTVKSRLNYGRKKIEVKVRELEKNGTKLYSLAPIPFLLWLFRLDSHAAIPSMAMRNALLHSLSSAGAHHVAGAGSKTVIGAGAKAVSGAGMKAAAGTASKAVIAKVVAGVVAISLIGGGTIATISHFRNQDTSKEVMEATEDKSWKEEATQRQTDKEDFLAEEAISEESEEDIHSIPPVENISITDLCFDEILEQIAIAGSISNAEYDANQELYNEQYQFLGDGIMWMLHHREIDAYTYDFFYRLYDTDADGEDELMIMYGPSLSDLYPVAIYNLGEEAMTGDAMYGIAFPHDPKTAAEEWTYLPIE